MTTALRPALIIVDSLGSAARGAEHRPTAIDALFSYLNDIAVTFQCGLLVIHHLRKHGPLALRQAPASFDGDEVRGSGHIVSLARSVLGLTAVKDWPAVQIGLDPHDNPPRRLQVVKTNLGPCPPPLGVTFTPAPDGSAGLAYAPAPEPVRRCTVVESCALWLHELLTVAGRPLAPREVERYASTQGYSRTTIYRARELLGALVIDTHGRYRSNNCWTIPPWPRP